MLLQLNKKDSKIAFQQSIKPSQKEVLTISHIQKICIRLLWQNIGEEYNKICKWKYSFLHKVFNSRSLATCLFWKQELCYIICLNLGINTSVNPFPHTTILQQTTLNIFCQKIENLFNWMDNLWLKVENIVTKGEIARFVQFLLLLLCFQKAVCCRGVRKRLYEGKGLIWFHFTQ